MKNEKELLEKYPSLFAQKDLPMNQTCMCWGIETDFGWKNLIDETCAKIFKLDKNKEVQFTQIKEKFGGLRIYINTGTDEIYKILDEAENKSFKVCEICGNLGEICSSGYWLKTLCHKCRKDTNYEVYDNE